MIELTRLNGHRLILNPDLIKFAESTPDTTLTLITGEKLIILDAPDDLITRIRTHRALILSQAWPDAAQALSARAAFAAQPAL